MVSALFFIFFGHEILKLILFTFYSRYTYRTIILLHDTKEKMETVCTAADQINFIKLIFQCHKGRTFHCIRISLTTLTKQGRHKYVLQQLVNTPLLPASAIRSNYSNLQKVICFTLILGSICKLEMF